MGRSRGDRQGGTSAVPASTSTRGDKEISAELVAVLKDEALPSDAFMFDGSEEEPEFTVGEAAKVFFARSSYWMRWRERNGFFVLGVLDVEACSHEEQVGETSDGKPKYDPIFDDDGICPECGGEAVGLDRTKQGARTYSLADIEKMAHSLAEKGAISGQQLRHTLRVAHAISMLYGHH